jgi:ribosome-associated protein
MSNTSNSVNCQAPCAAMALENLPFTVRGDHVTLDALLKLTGQASSGGAAKQMVAQGLVRVNGVVEQRKTCKLRPGAVVQTAAARITVLAPDAQGALP